MKVALYARCSTKDKGQDPETQLLPLRDFARLKGYEVIEEFTDRGWSGAKERRPQLDRLMLAARRRRVDAILVARFDRFARSVSHLLAAWAEFQQLQIAFISLNENFDTSTPIGKLVFTILAAIGEMERAIIRERVLAGMDRARRQGVRLGRPTVLVDRIRIRERVAQGEAISLIARESGIARATVRKIVQSREKGASGEKAE